ncbi:MAG TPA: hypothetical protein VHN77_12595 [Phycisphaerales bacterium]|nr:hypothetical protein [Phycisphaerales bacterium]
MPKLLTLALFAAVFALPACAQPHTPATPAEPAARVNAPDWTKPESACLQDPVQLTFSTEFAKAGESYIDYDNSRVIFQAVLAPQSGQDADPFYAMYVAPLTFAAGSAPALGTSVRISPTGSSNTCGWFDPLHRDRILLGSTVTAPAEHQKAGFQVGTRRYVWMFPAEMEVCTVSATGGATPVPLFTRGNYDAECSFDASGRFVLYTHVEDAAAAKEGEPAPRPDGNIYIYDTLTQQHHPIVIAPGYDGGPFFSPDGRSICYRSDRQGNDLLQVYVADLKFENDASGQLKISMDREWALTNNEHVNWAPYWHPSGTYLVYGSSEAGHDNYELFAIETDMDKLRGDPAKKVAGADPSTMRRVRITHAPGADILPAFSSDGKYLIWTSQRAGKAAGEQRPASQLWIARWRGITFH